MRLSPEERHAQLLAKCAARAERAARSAAKTPEITTRSSSEPYGTSHTEMRGGWFHYRRRVPSDLHEAVGKKVWKCTLDTRSLRIAEKRAEALDREHDRTIARLRSNTLEEYDEQIAELYGRHFDKRMARTHAREGTSLYVRKLLYGAERRARDAGLSFNLEPMDIIIPDHCPVLGIALIRGRGKRTDCSPSLDRLVPELGYVRGNVRVISWRANRIKHDGNIQELRAIVAYMEASSSVTTDTRGNMPRPDSTTVT